MENLNQVAAYNLRAARIRMDWSQSFVANLTGLSIRSISRAETGCTVSKKTVRRLCTFYRLDINSLYEKTHYKKRIQADFIPENVAVNLLIKNSFISDLQTEMVLRYNYQIRKNAVMMRQDVEAVLSDIISNKKIYTFSDIISCCMAVNQKTIENITDMTMA